MPLGGLPRLGPVLALLALVPLRQGFGDSELALPWPLGDGQDELPLGTGYGQYQHFDPSELPDYHDGIDILAVPGSEVYAIEEGTVVYVEGAKPLDAMLIVESSERPGTGLLYVHFLSEQKLKVGDAIEADQLLGETIAWDDPPGFDHLHLSRVVPSKGFEDDLGWPGFLVSGNPLRDIGPREDAVDPEILAAGGPTPGLASDWFAFCKNESDSYLSSDALSGKIDVVARIRDRFLSGTPPGRWLAPYAIELEIRSAATGALCHRNEIVLDRELGNLYDLTADSLYKTFGAKASKGSFEERDFYFVVTNSPPYGDGYWDTTKCGNGKYEVTITARDLSNRSVSASMDVTVP